MNNLTTVMSPAAAITSGFYFWVPLNGSLYSFLLIWSSFISSNSWFLLYSLTTSSFNPTVETKYPFAQNFLLPYFYFKFPYLSNIIKPLLPFKQPINDDTANFGGIATSIWNILSFLTINFLTYSIIIFNSWVKVISVL